MEILSEYVFEIVIASVYLIVLPMVISGFCALHKYLLITRRARNIRKEKDLKKLPKPLGPKIKRAIQFTLKQDTRTSKIGITNKRLLILLYLGGLITSVIGAFMDNWTVIGIGMSFFFISLIFSISSGKKILAKRDKLETKIFSVVDVKMAYSAEEKDEKGEKNLVRVTKWEEFLEPRQIEVEIPIKFSPEQQEEFSRHFNVHLQQLSKDAEIRAWVPSKEDGWNYADGLLTMETVPPLPTMAPWHENYLNPEYCAWSYFPLGLSVEHGVSMPNPDGSGEMQNVVGIDVSGAQQKLGKEKGVYVSPKLQRAPQILCAGSTGGGKSLAINTIVPTVKNTEI